MSISISNIDPNSIMVSDSSARDGSESSSADLFAQIKYAGKEITSCSVKDFEKWAVIHGVKMNLWRHESGEVSSTASGASAFLGMDEIEFTLPCSDVDITAIETIAKGQGVDITFMKTGNVGSHSDKIESFEFLKAQIVSTFFFLQTAATASITIRFKAKSITVTRFDYKDEKAAGQKVYYIDFVTNTSK